MGRWGGIPVRLHMLFFVFAVFTFYFGWYASQQGIASVAQYTALTALVILLFSVILHELGHLFVVGRCNCRVHLVELLPWGGCSRFDSPRHSPSRLMIHLAGPGVNLFLCALCGFLLLQRHSDWGDLWLLMNPIRPVGLLSSDFALSAIKLGFWINWLLLLVNLIPVFPFDGGNILRASVPMIWRQTTPHQAYLICLVFAQMTAVMLFFAAWILQDSNPNELVPTWFVLVMLGIIVFFSSKRQAVLDSYHLEQVDLARVTASPAFRDDGGEETYFDLEDQIDEAHISDWLHQHKQVRQQPDDDSEEDEDRKVDEILAKLHATGMNSLSQPERALLERVSARYRDKQQSGGS